MSAASKEELLKISESATVNNRSIKDDFSVLYGLHITEKMSRYQTILTETGYTDLYIASGQEKKQFQDNQPYPFKANTYFREWTPLTNRPDCYLHIRAGASKPRLLLLCVEDIWHTAPQALPSGFEQALDLVEYDSIESLLKSFNTDSTALVAEDNTLNVPEAALNPQPVLNQVDYQRRWKTPYEHACVREANRLAAPAHLAAYRAFKAGLSEREICAAYLAVNQCSENDMPYGVIAGLNEHAAILHHKQLDQQRPAALNSFLIDAGIDFHGYASDITRTYAYDAGTEFAAMITLMDQKQLELVAAGLVGQSAVDMHVLMQTKIAEVLMQFGILTSSVEAAIDAKIPSTFCPHSLGHHLGSNVHDRGARLANPAGDPYPDVVGYTGFNTAPIVANQIHTIEPGLYFIPSLLQKLKASEHKGLINWSRAESFIPYGGLRIEDNIAVHEDGSLENMTRDAFQDLDLKIN